MSYDIALLPRVGDERLEDTIARLALDEECELDPKLVAGWRELENNARRVVRGLRTTSMEPSCHELTDDRTGITVSAEHYITVSIPFWYDGEQRLEMLGTLLRLAGQIAADTGLAGHDLQVRRWLADGVTPAEAAEAYQVGRDTIAEPQQSAPAADSGRMGHGIIRFFTWSLEQRRRKRGPA